MIATLEKKGKLFEPLVFDYLEPRPHWWKVRPAEIIDICRNALKGSVKVIAQTPGGFPVHALFYGNFTDEKRQSNWSASSASGHPEFFAGANHRQTVIWCAGIHGAEAESVAASVNLIQLLETGTDFLGRPHPRLLELLSQYRLIILPCVNMDGRAISPDHLRKAPHRDFRHASQGSWLDGSLIEWLGSKEYFPLPLDKVAYPGGYPNSQGYNIMHDASPGNIRTAEARGILALAERYAVDFMLNAHSCEGQPILLPPCEVNYSLNLQRETELYMEVNQALFDAGLRDTPPQSSPARSTCVNLNTLIPLASGGSAMTLECCVSLDYSFEQLMDTNFVTLEAILESGLKKPLADRRRISRHS